MQELSESPGWILAISAVLGLLTALLNIWLGLVVAVAVFAVIKLRSRRASTTPSPASTVSNASTATEVGRWSTRWSGRTSEGKSHRDLYYIVLSALLGFNIFESLFGREVGHAGECGSWIRPNIEDGQTTSLGWFWDAGERFCPRAMSGRLNEAILSAVVLGLLSLVLKLRRQ